MENDQMSRCNDYTNGFVCMNRREQRAFTLAFVWLALKPNLTRAERRTLETFEKVWLAGRDFTEDRTFSFFVTLCKLHHVPIRFKKKPSDTGRRGEKGAMVDADWTGPEPNGSFWPAMKDGQGEKRPNADLVEMKKQYRTEVILREMARLGVSELVYKYDLDARIERVVDDRLREHKPAQVEQPKPEPVERYFPRPNGLDYGFDYTDHTNVTVH
jgi:hypothetical protein